MIKAEFYKRDSMVTGYRIGGHAFFDVVGKDIVCAAVSALTTAITNQIQLDYDKGLKEHVTSNVGIGPVSEVTEFIEISFIKQSEWNDALLTTLFDGLLDIEEEHPTNLKVMIKSV